MFISCPLFLIEALDEVNTKAADFNNKDAMFLENVVGAKRNVFPLTVQHVPLDTLRTCCPAWSVSLFDTGV